MRDDISDSRIVEIMLMQLQSPNSMYRIIVPKEFAEISTLRMDWNTQDDTIHTIKVERFIEKFRPHLIDQIEKLKLVM